MTGYKKIAENLQEQIREGKYKENMLLPSQQELAKKYHVSRVTINRAFNLLKEEEFITTRRGYGAVVQIPEEKRDLNVERYLGLTELMGKDASVSSTIISFSLRFPEEEEMKKLQISSSEPVYDIIRLRNVNGLPLLLEYTIMPIRVVPGIDEEILKKSIYTHIQKTLHLEIGASVRKIKADRPDAYDMQYLQCSKEDPVLEVEQTVRLKDGTPFEYSQTRSRYDHTSFIYYSSGRSKMNINKETD
jgi:GntR family transcriptional regulator